MPSWERAEWGILRDLARRNFTVAKLWLLFADSRPFMPIQAHSQFAKCMLGLPEPIHTHSGLHVEFALTQEVAASSPVVPAILFNSIFGLISAIKQLSPHGQVITAEALCLLPLVIALVEPFESYVDGGMIVPS